MSKTITSGGVTFMDLTDNRKLDAYITSNLPTTQIYNQNTKTYEPDWSTTNLQLNADIYLDAKSVTSNTYTSITWYKKVGTQPKTQVGAGTNLTINSNQLIGSVSIITYICEATYNDTTTNPPTAYAEIAFTRVDTGLNGSDGVDAPNVLAQYSVDGTTNWTSSLNSATHKYIRHSYDGGKTWSVAIKMVGEDGTSVKILGTATSATKVSGTDYYTLVYSSVSVTSAELGDAYLYNGDLYVCADSRDGQDYFINVGNIQGPSGQDGKSSYVFIRYATDANGTNMSTSPSGKTYMGIYTSNTNTAPTTASSYTWSKFVGDNAKSIVLSGDTQVFKVSKTNTITPSTIKVTTQAFNTTITNWTYSINGGQTFLSTAPTGVSRSGNIVTITGSAITSNSITIKASDGEIEDVFTIYKVVDGLDGGDGNDGAPAPIAFLTNENVTFSANAQGQISTTTITSNVVAYNGTTKVTPTIGEITGIPTGMTITSSTITASNEIMLTMTIANNSTLGSTSNNMGTISIPVTYPVSTVLSLTWSKVNAGAIGSPGASGADAYTVILTNESSVFAGDVSNAVAGSTTTQAIAYKGSTAQTVTIVSVNGKSASTVDTDTGITGLKFKCSALSGTSPTITFTCTTAFTSASGSIPVVLSVGGISFTKIFAYSIAFKGATGTTGQTGSAGLPATAYWLISSASAVQKTSTGTITVTPSTLTFTGKSQTGAGTPVDYACRWIIAYSTDGTNYTNLYTSTANEASKSINMSTSYKTIRARMYLAGGTTTLLDEQIIPIVSDGARGEDGVGINSVTVDYGVSTSASTQPTSWQTTIPVVAEGSYLWTRTIIDYTDDAVADTVTYTYSKQGVQGNIGPQGTSVTVSSIQYQAGTSATTAPTSTWSNNVVSVAEGSYLWTKTTFSDGKTAYGVARQGINGAKGNDGKGIKSVTEYYLATASSSGVTTSTSGWTTTVQTITLDQKYLWNYEVITYTDNTTSTTTPIIIGVFGNTGATGKGIKSVTEYYLATTLSSGVTTSTSGWTTTIQSLTATNKYLWNYELITYTDNSTATINPVIIGVYGDQGTPAVTFQVYAPNGYLLTKDLSEITLQAFAYEGSSAITSGATYQWAQYADDAWENISGATAQALTITKNEVVKSKSYKCTMTYKSKQYTDTATVQDKTDIYDSLIQVIAKYSSANKLYWVLYSTVYSDEGERDGLLGSVSTTAPTSPTTGQYWYKIDESNYTVTLMKYSGTAWAETTDKQELVYDWSLLNDTNKIISLGAQGKVKIITSSDFSKTCTVQCNVRGSESIPISYANQILIDPSDPIVSSTEPINPAHGQLWIKTGSNGLYTLLAWDATLEQWIVSETDSRVKVHISKPTSYEVGDVWVVGSDYEPTIYINGVAQTTKHLVGTMLKAQYSSQSYKDSDWVEALNYKKDINDLKENLNMYNQFFSADEDGLVMQAKDKNGVISEFKTKLTHTELGFYQGENKVAHINNNQLNISKAEITNGMTIKGDAPVLEIGNFIIIQESNGSLSIGSKS